MPTFICARNRWYLLVSQEILSLSHSSFSYALSDRFLICTTLLSGWRPLTTFVLQEWWGSACSLKSGRVIWLNQPNTFNDIIIMKVSTGRTHNVMHLWLGLDTLRFFLPIMLFFNSHAIYAYFWAYIKYIMLLSHRLCSSTEDHHLQCLPLTHQHHYHRAQSSTAWVSYSYTDSL